MFDIRILKEQDIKKAAENERLSLETAWSESQIKESFGKEQTVYIVAEAEGEIIGTASAYVVLDSAEIINIAVKSEHRKKGIGNALLGDILNKITEKGAKTVTLEVASDNLAAISLYEKHGFKNIGIRKNFYRGKNAIIMEKLL